MYNDKTLVCKDCGQQFTFTASEQEFFAEKGFTNEPQRCKACRDSKKSRSRENNGSRQMYDAVCAQCGKSCKVPFEPKNDRPVYCSDCFKR
ncbi:MAG: zinc-ribbon domain containing protein [Bacillota bacterium]|nr:zinc-ribbon domain containing protein [Bacillota bacterium]